MQQLRHDQVGDRVVDRRAQEDDPLVEQAAVDVELALAARGPLDHHRDEGHMPTVARRRRRPAPRPRPLPLTAPARAFSLARATTPVPACNVIRRPAPGMSRAMTDTEPSASPRPRISPTSPAPRAAPAANRLTTFPAEPADDDAPLGDTDQHSDA